MKITPSHRVLALLGGVIVFLALAGTASAYWSVTGSGSGSAGAGSALGLTTSAVTPSAQLYPGGTGDAKVTINNPNSFAVTVTDVTGGTITGSGGAGTCSTTGVTFGDQHNMSTLIAAHGSSTVTFANSVTMSNSSDNGCQGATFTIPVTITAHS